MNKFFMFVTLLLSLTLVFAFAGPTSNHTKPILKVSMERSPGNFDAVEYLNTQQKTFDWLMAEAASLSPDAIISIHVAPSDLEEMNNYRCADCGKNQKLRVGISKAVDVDVSFATLNPAALSQTESFQANGMLRTTGNGLVWTAAAESRDATALRVHLTDFYLPESAALYIYNLEGQAFGPYTGLGPNRNGDFWTNTVTGPIANLQVHFNGEVTKADLSAAGFVIENVAHMGPKFLLPFMQKPVTPGEGLSIVESFCSFNAACIMDASCYNNSAINGAKDAVAHMLFVSGAWYYICSGGLLADNDAGTQIPYFLSADHCISKSSEAGSLECYFQFKTTSCNGACYDPIGVVPRTLGAVLLEHSSKNGDFSLLQLNENPPAGSVFLGWNATPVAYTNNVELYRVSHPQGAPQAYSKHLVDADTGTCRSWPRGKWIYSTDVIGATEGGSSGSPVLNSAGEVVGQLSGSCGYNLDDVCDSESNNTVDGAFAAYYTEIESYLGNGGGPTPGTETHVDSIVLSTKTKGKRVEGIATVTIKDENGNPVENATVTGTFSGDFALTISGTTDGNGEVVLKTGAVKGASTFTFCVDNITHPSMSYDPGANVETCDSY